MIRTVSLAVVVAAVLGQSVAGSAAEGVKLVRASQMWGAERSDGKVAANIGIAAECFGADDRSVTCQFVSISVTKENECAVSTWSQKLELVSRTGTAVTWAGVKGPTGLSGVLTSTTLIADRFSMDKDSKRFDTYGPSSLDAWRFESIQKASAPMALT